MALREDYPSNSITKKPEKKPVEKVVKGGVTKKKQTFGEKLAGVFIMSDMKSVAQSIFFDTLVPAAKKTIRDMLNSSTDMLLYGDKRPEGIDRDRGRSVIRTDYRGISSTQRSSYSQTPLLRSAPMLEPLIFENRADAEEVLRNMYDLIDEFHVASVKDLYGFAGMSTDYTKEKYGWFQLDGAEVVRVSNGYLLNLPKPKVIE